MVSKNVIGILGDIGGTNSRLQIVEIDLDSKEPKVLYFPEPRQSSSFNSFIECIADFLKSAPQDFQPKIACLGIAGPVVDNETVVSNVSWPKVSGDEIKKAFNLDDVYLYNDFEIAACYVDNVSEENICLVNSKTAKTPKNKLKAVVGPGTGLGYCHLIPFTQGDKTEYHLFPSEGGHADFPAITDEQIDFMKYLMKTHGLTQVCLERAFAGQAIQDMYQFYKERLQAEAVIEKDHSALLNRNIIRYGIEKKDKNCEAVVSLLTQLLAQEIGNLALRTLSYSGVYVIGSIINSLREYILEDPENHFFKYYFNKSSNKHYEKLSEIPIYIVTFVECGLYGAYYMAQKCLRKKN